jgi:ubiquinol-cytochrome c reductase cytochrome b subunit
VLGSQFPGVVGMFSALLILLALPWLDRSKVKSIRYRSWPYKVALGVFVVSFITLGWLGMEPVTKTNSILARVFTVIYFGFFINNCAPFCSDF